MMLWNISNGDFGITSYNLQRLSSDEIKEMCKIKFLENINIEIYIMNKKFLLGDWIKYIDSKYKIMSKIPVDKFICVEKFYKY
jgi:hypothetical protein